MKNIAFLTIIALLSTATFAQNNLTVNKSTLDQTKFYIEPAIGMKPGPTSPTPGIIYSNLLQLKVSSRLSVISHTSYTQNNAFLRDFNFITTNYNYSLSQKFGIGASLFSKHSIHTFSLMAGIQFDNFKETLKNPEFEKVEAASSSLSPDFGLMYNLKIGMKKYLFSYRMYLPLYPYPFKSTEINSIDGNIANVFMEFGIGVRLN